MLLQRLALVLPLFGFLPPQMNAQKATSGKLRYKEIPKRCIFIFCLEPTNRPPKLPVSTTLSPVTTSLPIPLITKPPPLLTTTGGPHTPISPSPPTNPPVSTTLSPPPTSLSTPPATKLPPSIPASAPTTTITPMPPTVSPPSTTPIMPTKPTTSKPGEVSCPVPITKIGCYNDDQGIPRPLPEYILTDRDASSPVYSGREIDWGNWINYLPDFVCRCAKLTTSKGYKFFGVQFYGECWSGPSKDENKFKEDDQSRECVDTKWKSPCNDVSNVACSGKQFNNYVYAIQ